MMAPPRTISVVPTQVSSSGSPNAVAYAFAVSMHPFDPCTRGGVAVGWVIPEMFLCRAGASLEEVERARVGARTRPVQDQLETQCVHTKQTVRPNVQQLLACGSR